METNTIDSKILSYLPLLGAKEKESLLGVIKTFLDLKVGSGAFEAVDIEQYNKELDDALLRIANGRYLTQDEAEARSAKW